MWKNAIRYLEYHPLRFPVMFQSRRIPLRRFLVSFPVPVQLLRLLHQRNHLLRIRLLVDRLAWVQFIRQ